jgi:hypothetical protein
MPAASSGLSKPESAASYATRRDRGQAEVDCCCSEVPFFQMDSISKNNRAVESKSWFRTVPVDELVYRMIVRSLAALRIQAVQDSRLRLFEIG